MNIFMVILLIGWMHYVCVQAKQEISIGAILDENNADVEVAFKFAAIRENIYGTKHDLVPNIQKVDIENVHAVQEAACTLISQGVAAIFGPNSMKSSHIVASICNEFGIPHFVGHWSPELPSASTELHAFTRNLFPNSDIYSLSLSDIIRDNDWKTFTIIYDDDFALMRMQNIIQLNNAKGFLIMVRQLSEDGNYRPMFKEIATHSETHIILDCSTDKIIEVLKHARDVNMFGIYQSYIITTIDTYTLDFTTLGLSDKNSNITTLRFHDPEGVDAQAATHDVRQTIRMKDFRYNISPSQIKTEALLMHDAARLFSMGLREYAIFDDVAYKPSDCANPTKWNQGEEILKIIDEKGIEAISGKISFAEDKSRYIFSMEILEYSLSEGFKKIATWDAENGMSSTRSENDIYSQISASLANRTIIVASRIGMPYLGETEPEEGVTLEGNDRYEGFSKDLIHEIASIFKFKYSFYIVGDNQYGSPHPVTKKWNGLIRDILDRKADVAICDLTITSARRTAVDFSVPFMTLGVSILYSKPTNEPPSLWSFMAPLSLNVWLHMATAYLCVTITLLILSRMATDDWESSHPCEQDPDELETIWNMHNCIWLTVGSIMQQGCDILPKSGSTRVALSMWFFFALIIISSYTANLAAFLTMSRMDEKFENAEDLAKQTKIKYGLMAGGATSAFFRDSNFSLYQRMWSFMESAEPSVFVKDNGEGIERVAKSRGNYAFLMESLSIEYNVQKNCNLTQVGSLLDSKGYGIALPAQSPYRTLINQAILKLQEDGTLSKLKTRWWVEKNGGEGKCKTDTGGGGDTPELGLDNVGGVFLVLGAGLFVATIVGILDFLWNIRAIAIEEKITPNEVLKREIAFIINFQHTTKPVGSALDDILSSSTSSTSSKKSNKSGKSKASSRSVTSKNSTKLSESYKHDDNV